MASFEIRIKPSARDELMAIPFPFRRQLHQRILASREEPHASGASQSSDDVWRLRLSYGAIEFEISDEERLVRVLAIVGP